MAKSRAIISRGEYDGWDKGWVVATSVGAARAPRVVHDALSVLTADSPRPAPHVLLDFKDKLWIEDSGYTVGIVRERGRRYLRIGCQQFSERDIQAIATRLEVEHPERLTLDRLVELGFPEVSSW